MERAGQYRCINAGTERLKNSFYLKAIRLLNSKHWLREAAAYMETWSLATLTNGSLVTLNNAPLNNATLIMFTYPTLLTCIYCILYHLLHLAYAAWPSLIHIFICTYSHSPLLDLCVLGSCWGTVRLLVRYYCIVGTRRTSILNTRINIC
jgi:hypothetical protein